MFPKWFDKWNRENPTNMYGPAIIIGAVGSAVFVAAFLVTWGQPFATVSTQTGPRGIGMSVTARASDAAMPDPTIVNYFSDEPWVPEPGDQLAGEIYENVQVLGDLTDANFNRLMAAMTEWVAPDQGCVYCHAGANEGNYADDSAYTKVVARSMIQMTQSINYDWVGHVQANAEVGVTCYTCHRGQNVPSEIWFRITPVTEGTAGWASNQNRATSLSQYTSLPSDALEKYLLGYESIKVHDLDPRVATQPGDPTWQNAERTFSLMNYFANSLGVNCVFCHNSRAFYDPAQVTPQWGTASLGIAMVQELNNDWIVPIGEANLPPNRLGPIYADAPKVACKTCHKAYSKPMQGLNVIANYPELATTTGEYDYSAFTDQATN